MASTPSAAPALTLTFTSLLPYSNTHSIDLSRVLSDGDDTHRPATARNMTRNPVEDFLDLLAQHFNDNQDYLTALKCKRVRFIGSAPLNYVYMSKQRGQNERDDKYVYGHPRHKEFVSIKQFAPHVFWLLHHYAGLRPPTGTCECNVCNDR